MVNLNLTDEAGDVFDFLKWTPHRAEHHDRLAVMLKMTAFVTVDVICDYH